MREIGVRELKASLSEVLRSVSRGEPVRVTRRGQTLADIVPAGARAPDERLATLVAQGRLSAPAGTRPAKAPPLARATRLASDVILEERDAER
jgi:prevent-host-death family protein